MQPRNVLIHIVFAFAALHAAVLANPVLAAGTVVAYPEGDVLVFAPADATND
jgi:hypothetical protein